MLKIMFKRFARDRGATIALITAIFIFPLMFLGVGVPIDLARAIQYRANLQNIADAAALAGSEVLGVGATPLQACNLTLAYVQIPIDNGELGATAKLNATLSSPGDATTTPPTGSTTYVCGPTTVSKPQITQAAAPNVVGVTISGSQPTTFLAIYNPKMPVSVSSSAIGPQGFITICADAQPNPSGDLSQVYYYLRNPDGTFANEDGSPVNPSSDDTLPGDPNNNSVSLTAFLGDDKYPTNNKPTLTPKLGYNGTGYCDKAGKETAVLVKPSLAQRLGFAYYVVSNAQAPCTAVPNFVNGANPFTDLNCLSNKKNYTAYNPSSFATSIGQFFNYYQTWAAYKFLPNAYGSPVGWVNAFYSTDYPASLNSNNLDPNYSGAGTAVSPTAGDSCFTQYVANTVSTVASVVNGFSATNADTGQPVQSCIINESATTLNRALTTAFYPTNKTPTKAPNITPGNPGNAQTNSVFWANWYQLQAYNGQTSTGTDLVCLVANGATYTPAITTYNKGTKSQYSVAKVTAGVAAQQENFVIANNTDGATGTVYHCPDTTLNNDGTVGKWYPDPTCPELNGATLQVAWNDMGGILYDNGNYVDLVYSYSCQPPAATDVINSAIIQ
jgi:Flp pilus assembly protein TadG